MNESDPYGDSYHLFGLIWNETSIVFTVDDIETGGVTIPEGGSFWKLGEFEGNNLWEDGDHMAPFDKEVTTLFETI